MKEKTLESQIVYQKALEMQGVVKTMNIGVIV